MMFCPFDQAGVMGAIGHSRDIQFAAERSAIAVHRGGAGGGTRSAGVYQVEVGNVPAFPTNPVVSTKLAYRTERGLRQGSECLVGECNG